VPTEHGYVEAAYRLLLNETFPSWGYSIREGATTIWERWDGWTAERGFQDPAMNSFNHSSLGSVGEWLFRQVAGIDVDPKNPGFRHSVIRPWPGGGITHAHACYRSVVGMIESAWRFEGDTLLLDMAIPANTSATVYVPATESAKITESGVLATAATGVRQIARTSDEAVFAVESGTYSFRVEHGGE
jgi:alpha-L-rhamnosidase